MPEKIFRVGISRDFLNLDGTRKFDDVSWRRLEGIPSVELEFLEQEAACPVTVSDVKRFDVLLIKRNAIDAATLAQAHSEAAGNVRLRLIVRNGAGFDHIDIGGCSRMGVMVSLTRAAVAHSVASSIMALLLAFSHRLPERDRMTRAGNWSQRWAVPGKALKERTLGVIGLGHIGLEVFRLAQPWGMRHLGVTPNPDPLKLKSMGVDVVDLETLLRQSDFVVLCCPLNEKTHHMLNASALALMRSDAILINTARGEIIDEDALVQVLKERRIGGAGIDVYEVEPPPSGHPLFELDNVILGSHNLAYSDELNQSANRAAVDAIAACAAGVVPDELLNPQVLTHSRFDN